MTLEVVLSGGAAVAAQQNIQALVDDRVASRVFAKDSTLWGTEAESEASIRMGWVEAADTSIKLVAEVSKLRTEFLEQGISRVVLCGMGGSSLAPEVIANSLGVELVILDSTDPSQVELATTQDLAKTVVVVSSKSGSTVETDSQKRSFEQSFRDSAIDPEERILVVTDPDSPMHKQALIDGYRVFLADPTVGGRFSALTAFGVVPAVLAGVEMTKILESAVAASKTLRQNDEKNPALLLGAAMAKTRGVVGYKDKLGIYSNGTSIIGFGDWVEQLVAESTGKLGRGVLPVVLDSKSVELSGSMDDLLIIEIAKSSKDSKFEVSISGDLGELMLLWEVATVIASRLIEVNPFDQPDVESAKIAARAVLDSPSASEEIDIKDQEVEIASEGFDLVGINLERSLLDLFDLASADSYFSIQCYLNRHVFAEASKLRNLLASRTGRPTTFGWGPRFLHSTGQYHKGGPKQGLFIQIVSGEREDLAIPGRTFSYRQLIDSQSSGDARVLGANGSPVLILKMHDPKQGLKRLSDLLG